MLYFISKIVVMLAILLALASISIYLFSIFYNQGKTIGSYEDNIKDEDDNELDF